MFLMKWNSGNEIIALLKCAAKARVQHIHGPLHSFIEEAMRRLGGKTDKHMALLSLNLQYCDRQAGRC